MKTVLITGAGSGFGLEVAMRLAEKGFDVIASVEIYAQVQTLKRELRREGSAFESKNSTSPMMATARRHWGGTSKSW